jgi:8-oxo-dGTP pyrophosphatase MutT (NUDIX family)
MGRIDYYEDPSAPKPNSIVPAASAIVINEHGDVLLQKRADTGQWSLPGGALELGESIAETIIREVREETGLQVSVDRVTGVYSNPRHVVAFSDGEVRQQFSVCFLCAIEGGQLAPGEEATEVGFFDKGQVAKLDIHPSIRLRIHHYWEGGNAAAIA